MPLPTPNDNESQDDFMARCMPVVADDATYETQEQRVAVCMSQFRSATKGIKVLDEGKGLIGGWGIPFGGPVKDPQHADGKDLDGEYFHAKTNFCFDWFPNEGRPVLYDHGTDPEVKLTTVGRQVSKFVDPKLGVWVEAQLDMANQYAKAILELAKKGVLAYSSGALGGYVRRGKGGSIDQWPYIEQTVTVRPANPYALIAADAVKHLKEAGYTNLPEIPEPETGAPTTLIDAIKAELEPPAKSRKKLVLPDGMSFTEFRTEVEEAARHLPGIEDAWFMDAKDDLAYICVGDDYYSVKFVIGTDGDVTLTQNTLTEVEQVTTWEPEGSGKAALEKVAEHLESVGWKRAEGTKQMSARQMGQMHQSMQAQKDLHASACTMGEDCPLYDASTTKVSAPVDPAKEATRQELDEYLATIKLERGSRHA